MKRRALLSLLATAPVAGCLGRTGEPAPRLAWLWLVNDRDDAHDVSVTVEADGEPVFSETYTLDPEADTANVSVEDPVDGAGQYVVRAEIEGDAITVDTVEYVDGDENCIGVQFTLLNNGSEDYWVKSMEEC